MTIEFNDMTVTDKGLDLVAKTLAGKTFTFTRAVAGEGVPPDGQNIKEITELISPVLEMKVRRVINPEGVGRARVKLWISNAGLKQFFLFREMGLFAEDPDTGEDFLYAYCTAKGSGVPISAFQEGRAPLNLHFDVNVIVGRAKVLTVPVDDPLNVTFPELQEELDAALLDTKAREDRLQYQIDCLAEASIRKSLAHAEQELEMEAE